MGPAALPEVSFSDAVTCGQLAWASCGISTLLRPTKGTKKDEATSVRPHGRQTTLGSTQAKSRSPDTAKPLKNTHNTAAGAHLQRPGVPAGPHALGGPRCYPWRRGLVGVDPRSAARPAQAPARLTPARLCHRTKRRFPLDSSQERSQPHHTLTPPRLPGCWLLPTSLRVFAPVTPSRRVPGPS